MFEIKIFNPQKKTEGIRNKNYDSEKRNENFNDTNACTYYIYVFKMISLKTYRNIYIYIVYYYNDID